MATPVLWLGLLEGPSGYADEARAFLRVLEAAGHEPAARELIRDGSDARLSRSERALLRRQLERTAPEGTIAVHHYAPAWARETPEIAGVANVARTMFETDRVPVSWLPQLVRRDEVWVPSAHGREAFERGGIPSERLRIVPGTLDFDLYAPGAEPLALDVPDGHLVFLSNFAFSERKAWRELLAAWARAFDPRDPVCLVLKTSAPQGAGALRARIEAELAAAARAAGRTATAAVRVMTDTLAPSDLVRLYAAADAYVLASRGEGWGRPYMEAMAVGLPTIASNWSGNLEFMRPETSWLVDGELVEVPADHDTFADEVKGHRWFAPDLDALAGALAGVAADPDAARRRAAGAREDLIARFGPDAMAACLGEALDAVAAREARLGGPGGRAVVLRGLFGRNESLAHVNDRLLSGLEAGGRRVLARTPHALYESLPATTLSHSWPPEFKPATDGPTAVILPWEYGDAPRRWVDAVARDVDLVVVPSEYVRRGYVASGMAPGTVEVVPNGFDPERFRPDGDVLELPAAACTFLFVGGTIWRKGIDLLLAAWRRAFGPDDDVLLVVKDFGSDTAYRNNSKGGAVQLFQQLDDVAPVHYVTDRLAPEVLPALYRAADVLVHPYRGEGFGLPILEAMACGLPPIHTAIGPSAEFVPGDAGWAVEARRVVIPPDPEWVLAGTGYAHECDLDALVAALRAAAADPAERARRGAAALSAAQGYTWSHAAERLEEALAALEADALAPVRTVPPAELEARGTVVAYGPDWSDEAAWGEALDRWARSVAPDADVTLALAVSADEAEAVAERVLARFAARGLREDALPDLVLHAADDALATLVGMADAVLLDARQAAAVPPVVRRRARAVVDLDALEAFAARLGRVAQAA